MSAGITIVGLGPSTADLLTRRAWACLSSASEVYVRTEHHPVINELPDHLSIQSFDHLYDDLGSFEAVYQAIAERLIELGTRAQGVIYAVPGDPSVGEATVGLLRAQAAQAGLPLNIIPGVSFVEPTLALLSIDALDGLVVADALVLAAGHHPPFPPDQPVLVAQLYSKLIAAEAKLTLLNLYPHGHEVTLIQQAGSPEQVSQSLALAELDVAGTFDLTTSLFIPPWLPSGSFEALQETVAHLRAPDGCPWDREQTHQSLRNHLMEETFEALDAIDHDDMQALQEELGDLLLQIVLQAQIAAEAGSFLMQDVIAQIRAKLIRRHPHVFADLELDQVDEVLHNWEALKEEERRNAGEQRGLLDGVPLSLPALAQAEEIQARVARVGFDWPELEGVLAKVHEEIDEVGQAADDLEQTAEMGDLLFAVVNYARWLKVDPEAALRQANQRFRERFRMVERLAEQRRLRLSDLSIDQLEQLWLEAKEGHDA